MEKIKHVSFGYLAVLCATQKLLFPLPFRNRELSKCFIFSEYITQFKRTSEYCWCEDAGSIPTTNQCVFLLFHHYLVNVWARASAINVILSVLLLSC